MKRKTDFYIALYEQLALQGFKVAADFDSEHIGEICFKGSCIAHLTRTDHIIPNPNAEIPPGAMEQLQNIARETAAGFTVCTKKPYDEIRNYKFSDGSYKLAEHNGMVLACGKHHLLGYLFYTFPHPDEIGHPARRETFFSRSDAARDFAVRSGLINENEFFTAAELTTMYVNAVTVRIMPGNDLSAKETKALDSLIEKIEHLAPWLADAGSPADLANEHDNGLSEGVEP